MKSMPLLRVSLLLVIAAAVSCAARPEPGPPDIAIPFPADRQAAAPTELGILGKDAVERYAGTSEGDALRLESEPGNFAWALYHFTPNAPFTLTHVDVRMTVPTDSRLWAGVANYSTQRWDLLGPRTGNTLLALDPHAHLSPAGNVYVVVIAGDGDEGLIDRVLLTTDDTAWITATVAPGLGSVSDASMAVICGKPAFAYCAGGSLYYIRAVDIFGSNWAPAQLLAPASVDASLGLAELGPAIAYTDESQRQAFIAALDNEGVNWGPPVPVDLNNTASHPRLISTSLRPTVAYCGTSGQLLFVRATAASGANWNAPQLLYPTANTSAGISIATVGGPPVVSFSDSVTNTLQYMRALDNEGTNWGAPLSLDTGGDFSGLAMIDNYARPGIVYRDADQRLKVIRATDLTGSAWELPQGIDVIAGRCFLTYFSGIPGTPWLAWLSTGGLQAAKATDQSGTSWDTPYLLDRGLGSITTVGLLEVEMKPAVGYVEDGVLKFARQQ
jgi:hypothetical protein